MKKNLICILVLLALCVGCSCQEPTPPEQTPDNPDSTPITTSKAYGWYPVTLLGGRSSGVLVNINETAYSAYTYEQIENGEAIYGLRMSRIDEVMIPCSIECSAGVIPLSNSDFKVKLGIGPTTGSFITNLKQKYNHKIDSVSITFTIDNVTYSILEHVDFEQIEMVLAWSTPIFDAEEGKLSHLYRYYRPIVGEAAVPLSLFDFSEKTCVDVTVNAILYIGDEAIVESYAPCTFQLQKNENGYEFVGTDITVTGYVAIPNIG